jgi:hypothetical protein
MNKPTIYIETSFVSLLVARPSRDILTGQRQHYSRIWWEFHRHNYTLMSSRALVEECRDGDPELAAHRLAILEQATFVGETTPQMRALQKLLVVPLGPLPELARTDALHLAIAAVSGCNFLLTWNFTHLINPQIRRMTDNIIRI